MALVRLVRPRSFLVFLLALAVLGGFAARNFWTTRAEKPAVSDMTHSAYHGLSSTNAFDRANAVKALRVMHDPAAVPVLIEHLGDPDQAVGLYMAQALGDLAGEDALPALRSALRDPNADVRWRAAYALGQLQDTGAVDGLANALRDPEVLVQRTAAEALAEIGNQNAISALADVLGNPESSVTSAAMAALERVGEPAVRSLALATNSTNSLMRRNATTVLGYIASPQALPALQLAVVDPDPAVRAEAQWALGQIKAAASQS